MKFVTFDDFGILVLKAVRRPPLRRWARPVGAVIADLDRALRGGRRRTIVRNLSRFDPSLDDRELDALARRVYRSQWSALDPLRSAPPRVEGLDRVRAALERGRGVILWHSPFGSRPRLHRTLMDAGIPFVQIQAAEHGGSRSWVGQHLIRPLSRRAETRFLPEFIDIDDSGYSYLRTLTERLAANQAVCMPGLGPKGQRFVERSFLGRTEWFATGVPGLAMSAGVPLIPVYTFQESNDAWVTVFEEPLPLAGTRHEGQAAAIDRFIDLLESYVRRYPEQWRRWFADPIVPESHRALTRESPRGKSALDHLAERPAVLRALRFAGAGWRRLRRGTGPRDCILCYHSVHPSLKYATCAPDEFDRHLRWLTRECDVVPLAKLFEAGPSAAVRPRVAITFDDGYVDNFERAFPVLKKYGVPASFFVTAGFVDRDPVVMARFRLLRRATDAELEPLTWDHLREMSAAGMEIGSHTYSHPSLLHLSDEDVEWELARSRELLQERLGCAVAALAYPFGKPGCTYGAREADIARRVGYACALTTVNRALGQTDSRWHAPRLSIVRGGVLALHEQVEGVWDWIGTYNERAPLWVARAVSPRGFRASTYGGSYGQMRATMQAASTPSRTRS